MLGNSRSDMDPYGGMAIDEWLARNNTHTERSTMWQQQFVSQNTPTIVVVIFSTEYRRSLCASTNTPT